MIIVAVLLFCTIGQARSWAELFAESKSQYDRDAQVSDQMVTTELRDTSPQSRELADKFRELAATDRALVGRYTTLLDLVDKQPMSSFTWAFVGVSEEHDKEVKVYSRMSQLYDNEATYWSERVKYYGINLSGGRAVYCLYRAKLSHASVPPVTTAILPARVLISLKIMTRFRLPGI